MENGNPSGMAAPPPAAFSSGELTTHDPELADGGAAEESVHDQLPTVEEIRNSVRMERGSSLTKNDEADSGLRDGSFNWCFFCFLLGIALVLGSSIGLAIGLTKNKRKGSSAPQVLEPRTHEVVLWLKDNSISLVSDLEDDENSPSGQYQAANWLADEDPLRLPIPETGPGTTAYIDFVERYVLTLLYYELDGANWEYKLGFLSSRANCLWRTTFVNSAFRTFDIGATCGDLSQVQALHIPGNNLKGSLPSEIAHLSELRFLALNTNQISDHLPREMGTMTNLDYVAFQYNLLTGSIPSWLGDLTSLRVLGLGNNVLIGSIPTKLAKLTNLVTLGLDDNSLTGDVFHLQNMKSMKRLYLEDNTFMQPLDTQFFTPMQELEELDLSTNNFTGTIPQSMFSFEKLKVLDLHNNELKGPIPSSIPVDTSMIFLALQQNGLTGPIPTTIGNIKNLTHLDVSTNKLTGTIPEGISGMSDLTYLFLGPNEFDQGAIPEWVTGLTNLKDLSLMGTNRTGPIPSFLGNMKSLTLLSLEGNNLTNGVPGSLSNLTDLQFLILSRNEGLTGAVPAEIQAMDLDIFTIARTSVTGDLGGFCDDDGKARPRILMSDCAPSNDATREVTCTCCSTCCSDDNVACDDIVYFGTLDPIWEHSYERRFYRFAGDIIFDAK